MHVGIDMVDDPVKIDIASVVKNFASCQKNLQLTVGARGRCRADSRIALRMNVRAVAY